MPKAQIIGLGRSGIAAARLLKQSSWQVVLSDRNISEVLQKQQHTLAAEGITVNLGDSPLLDSADLPELIVVSPGVPWDIPFLEQARNQAIDTIGELELAWRYLNSSPWVGITGTNGKTTTTALVAAIFQKAGFQAPACGNIGHAACELALDKKANQLDWVIAEISSYQIESSQKLAPKIGVWTTFTPDHLERHKTLENYYSIKASLLQRSQLQVLNGDDPYLRQLGKKNWPNAYWTSVRRAESEADFQPWVYLEDGWVIVKSQKILPVASLKMVGEHNYQNLLMAVAVAELAGIEPEKIAQAIADFPGVPHRLERIIHWQGINFINDSKATNYDAAQVGLASVDSPAILIAGGQGKAGDDTSWLKTIQAKAAAVLLIGEAASNFAQRLEQVGYFSYEIVETMEKAVPRSWQLAQKYHAQVVLLSPACASFDQYQSFEHRGEHFRQLCQELVD